MKGKRKRRPVAAKSTVISLRVSREQSQRLQRRARQVGRTPSETGAILVDEGLRRAEFAFIDFLDSAVGRQACILGTRVPVWQVIGLLRSFDGETETVAAHLGWPLAKVRAAVNYASAFKDEIETALADARSIDLAQLQRILPQIEELLVPPA